MRPPRSVTVGIAGVPVSIESEIPLVLELAAARFPVVQVAPVSRLMVHARDFDAGQDESTRWHVVRDQLELATRGLSARVDLEAGVGTAHVDERALATSRELRRGLLDGVFFTLITRRDRHPIHAATLRLGDAALVLHGASGVGKSTLAWAAHRAGVSVLSDDASRIQLSPEVRVWGDGTFPRIHLLDHVRNGFDDLRALPAERMSPGDEPKIAVEARDAAWVPFARRPRVVLLTRSGADRVSRRPASPVEIRECLASAPEAELDLAPGNRERVLSALAAPGGWHLDLSSRADDAIPHVRAMFAVITTSRDS